MPIPIVARVLAVVVAAGGLVAGCGTHGGAGPIGPAPPVPTPGGTTGASEQHTPAEVAFAQGMIPDQGQVIAVARLAPDRAGSTQVRALAARIVAEQDSLIQQLTALLRAWGAALPATTDPLTGDQRERMPGMLSDAQMHQLTASSGPVFDRMFLQLMIIHHRGAIIMSQTELAQGTDPATDQLAQHLVLTEQAQIQQMRTLLRQLPTRARSHDLEETHTPRSGR